MAAHCIRILCEIVVGLPLDQIRQALDYAPGMDQLDLDDWRKLKECTTSSEASLAAMGMLGYYLEEWERLDHPKTCEEWNELKYNSSTLNDLAKTRLEE